MGDTSSLKKIEQLILSQNRLKRSDLSVGMAASQLSALLEKGNIPEAEKLFRRQIHSLGQTGGGNFYYDIAEPYIRFLIAKGDKSEARRNIALVRRKLASDSAGILGASLDELEASAK
jgi:hypothetical protein